MACVLVQRALIDGEEHRGGVDGLVVEGGEELRDEQTEEGARTEVVGRLKRGHELP